MTPEEQKAYDEALRRIKKCRNETNARAIVLDLRYLGLSALPPEIGDLDRVKYLHLDSNSLSALPPEIGNLSALLELHLERNKLSSLPPEIGNLSSLTTLDLGSNDIRTLPGELGRLSALKILTIPGNGLLALPPEIGDLEALETLNLAANQFQVLPPQVERLNRLTELYVNANQLKSLPPEIGGLSSLNLLDVSHNRLITLPAEIGQLGALQHLDLSNNELNSLPPEVGQLSSLRAVSLVMNKLKEIPRELINLPTLRELLLGGNRILTFPQDIDFTLALERISLWGNGFTYLPATICRAQALVELDLEGNSLSSLPPEIRDLKRLVVLNASDNQISALPPEIGELSSIQILNLRKNEIVELPRQIGQLANLRDLDLAYNKLKSIPPELGGLFELSEINLQNNQLETLPREIGNLRQLTEIALQDNQLRDLPFELLDLSSLTEIYLHGNPKLGLPSDILGHTWKEVAYDGMAPTFAKPILDYYFAQKAGGSKPLNEVKVILVGRGGTGKTSIRKRLVDNRFDPKQQETPGIEIDHWKVDRKKDGIEAHLWDFAGQEITHATHQFFLTKRSLYLLVLDGRSDSQDRDAEYWLRLIRAFGGESPVLVLLNKWDDKPFPLQDFTLRREFPQIRGFIRTDCRTGLGIAELEKTIRDTVKGMETVTMPFPALWAKIKDRLAGMTENYLPLCDYRRLCEENGLSEKDQQDSLAETLHHLGIILHYADDARLLDTTVLNPRWVTTSVYTLLRHVEKRQKTTDKFTGHLTLAEARAALPEECPQKDREGKPLDMVAYLLGLMERFELCYPLESSDEKEKIWLIPQLLAPQNPADLGDVWFREPATRLRYEYNVLPEGLLPRFIVRAHPLVYRDQVWRQGVVLEMEDEDSATTARALVIAEPARERIETTVIGPAPARLRLTKLVRAHFEDIHATFSRTEERNGKSVRVNNLDARELVELEAQPGHFQSVRTLLLDEQKQNVSTIATDDQGSVRIDQSAELDRVASPSGKERSSKEMKFGAAEFIRYQPRIFLSYAHADAAYRDVFLQNLEVMKQDGVIDAWYDGKVLASQDFDKEIRRALDEADLIIFLISTASLRSKYIREVEIARAMVRLAERADWDHPVRVVPIVLEQDCAWKSGPLAHLQGLPGDRRGNFKAVDQWPNRRKAFNAVEQALRKLIKGG